MDKVILGQDIIYIKAFSRIELIGIYENNSYKNRGGNVMQSLRRREIVDGVIIICLGVSAGYVFASPTINIKNDKRVVEQKVKEDQETVKREQLAIEELLKQNGLEDEQKTIEEQKAIEKEYIERKSQFSGSYPVPKNISVTKIEIPIGESKIREDSASISDDRDIYTSMHHMINTKIIAIDDKIWGEVEITPEYCEELIELIKGSDYADKETLILFLNNWKKGSFKNGVNEHNYLWSKLDGDIGKAIALRDGVK
jgi:hypothetical protein